MRKIILNTLFEEKRGAILENGHVVEWLYKHEKGVAYSGNIIKGQVIDIVPGMDAAFVDLGDEKNGYLYKNELIAYQKAVENDEPVPSITNLITKGQSIIVQVKKEATGTKGARLTEQYSLPGKYIVYLPSGNYVAVSKKMSDDAVREQWRNKGKDWIEEGEGLIIRTNAEQSDESIVYDELIRLRNQYHLMLERGEAIKKVPALLYDNDSLFLRVTRDFSSDGKTEIIVDSVEDYQWLKEWVDENNSKNIHLYQGKESIFHHYGLEKQLEKSLKPNVWLKNGSSLVIETTEALTVIDVNTGKYVGKGNFRDTVLNTNIEAAKVVAEQLRLRDIGGIIIIDFIEMKEENDKEKVLHTLKNSLKYDRTITNVAGFTKLGLVEMTRKKTRKSLADYYLQSCQTCFGKGKEWSSSAVIESLRRAAYEHRYSDDEALLIEITPQPANELLKDGGEKLKQIEQAVNKTIYLLAKETVENRIFGYTIRLTGDLQSMKEAWLRRR
ncbi:Rne/Rng family ribonuclease [Evansella halocellulosilytica]|uniref:Rne/Rng family ribonuclease n=1 Tax=Evansella halocellulosilytica TaxID=2011013 RepID=UPI0015CDD869|nr:Rne/Rng family ribonuclease [Evansella halocellulosilytica]